MKLPFFLLLSLLPACLISLGRAAENVAATKSDTFSLAAVTAEALQNNPSIRAALSKWMAMKTRVPQAAAWDDPTMSAAFNAARFVEVPRNAFMNQTVTIEQMIPISGKNRVRARIAAAEAIAALEEVRRQQLDVITKVRAAWLRLVNGYVLLELNEKNIQSLGLITEVARSRYETGKESVIELLLAETEASRLKETRADLERMISNEKSQLNVLMNRDAFAPLGVPRKESLPAGTLSRTDLRVRMLAQRPEIRAAHARAEAEKEKVQLARREWIPDPTIMVQGQRYNGTQKTISELNTGISFSIPWGNSRKYSAGTREAESNLTASKAELERVQKEAAGLLRDQLRKIETTRRQAALFRGEILAQAQLAVAASRFKYEAGEANFSEWIGAYRVLRDIQATGLNYATDHEIAIAELDGIVGAQLRPLQAKRQNSK